MLWGGTLALWVALSVAPSVGLAQRLNPNERAAPPLTNVEDKDDIHKQDGKIWVLDFKFYDPRTITVDIPGRGRKICWYLKYQVINNTNEPRTFIPDFVMVTPDKPGATYHDQVLPKVQEAIRQVEDPTGYLDIKNSVTIASKPIPPSKPNAFPHAVTGVAIWDDIDPEANRFSIFVSGLSNGWSLAEIPPDNKQVVRRKTLQLNFKRLGERYYQRTGEIRFVPPVEWVYRATNVIVPTELAPAKAPEVAEKPK
ncbi:MAG TPA: hypothetical protein VKU02_05245 [Gemmataceae bacterium]|nr:hypothetical protein [Gemmataceae bacterium]